MEYKYRCSLLRDQFVVHLVILLLAGVTLGYGESKPKKQVKHWQADLAISPYYDSNILKYSDKYIQRFLNREDEGRFHINRYDDMVVQYSGGLSYENTFIKKLKTIFSVDASYNRYSFNNVKDWSRFSIGWRQYFYSKSSFMFSYSYIPHFYVRHFRDEDWIAVYGYTPNTFQPYEFSKDDFSFWIQHYIFEKTSVRLYASYYRYFLDKNNTEYDSNDYMLGFRVFHTLTKNLGINAGYKYYKSKAKGYDEPGETATTSDDVNADNYSHDYFVGLAYQLPKVFKMKNSISVDVNYERTFFTTDHFYEIDPIHAGRHDKVFDLELGYSITLPGKTEVSAFYALTTRKTGTPAAVNAEYISDEKSYNQYQTGIKISYSLKF
jgi:hypothetical protein